MEEGQDEMSSIMSALGKRCCTMLRVSQEKQEPWNTGLQIGQAGRCGQPSIQSLGLVICVCI